MVALPLSSGLRPLIWRFNNPASVKPNLTLSKVKFGILKCNLSKIPESSKSTPSANFLISGKKFYNTASMNFSFIATLTPSQIKNGNRHKRNKVYFIYLYIYIFYS